MTPTYTITEVLNLLENSKVNELSTLAELLLDELYLYNDAEREVITQQIILRRSSLAKELGLTDLLQKLLSE